MSRPIKSSEDLIKGIEHIRYSVFQLTAMLFWRSMDESKKRVLNRTEFGLLQNACIESSLLGLRILDEFFTPQSKWDNDMKALDYGFTEAASFLKKEAKDKINTNLAHLSWLRVDNKHAWTYELTISALPACLAFYKHIIGSYLLQTEVALLEEIKQEANQLNLFLERERNRYPVSIGTSQFGL